MYKYRYSSKLLVILGLSCFSAGVLSRLLRAQQLDEYDIESTYILFRALQEGWLGKSEKEQAEQLQAFTFELPTSCGYKDDAQYLEYRHAMHHLLGMSQPSALQILCNYLVAASAKDCSLLIAFRRSQNISLDMDCHCQEYFGFCVEHQIGVIDLDMKSPSKLEVHFKLDQEIMRFAEREQLCT